MNEHGVPLIDYLNLHLCLFSTSRMNYNSFSKQDWSRPITKAYFSSLTKRYGSSHRLNYKILVKFLLRNKNRCNWRKECQFFLRVSAHSLHGKQTSCPTTKGYSHFNLSLSNLTRGLCNLLARDWSVTWRHCVGFLPDASLLFPQSFDAKKSWKKVSWKASSKKEPLCCGGRW